MEIILTIENLHCASCVQAIEKKLGTLEEVIEVCVNLMTEKVYITTSKDVSNSFFIQVLKKIGYIAYEA